jgi:hypothetical protein
MLLQMISLNWQAERCVYVSGFFNDVVSTEELNLLCTYDRVQAGTQIETLTLRFCRHDDIEFGRYLPFRRNEPKESADN